MPANETALVYIQKVPLFAAMEDRHLQAIARVTSTHTYDAGTPIYGEGDPATSLHFVISGSVRVFKSFADGREYTLEIASTSQVFGALAFLDREPYPASAETLEASMIGVVGHQQLRSISEELPGIPWRIIRELARRLRRAQDRSAEMALLAVHERLANTLYELAVQFDEDKKLVRLPRLTHQQLANMVGASRETVTRAMQDLRKAGALRRESSHWLINTGVLEEWTAQT